MWRAAHHPVGLKMKQASSYAEDYYCQAPLRFADRSHGRARTQQSIPGWSRASGWRLFTDLPSANLISPVHKRPGSHSKYLTRPALVQLTWCTLLALAVAADEKQHSAVVCSDDGPGPRTLHVRASEQAGMKL